MKEGTTLEPIKKIPLLPFVIYLLYILLWGVGRYLAADLQEFSPILATTVFFIISIIPFGVVAPLKAAKRLGFKLHDPRSFMSLLIGVLIFLAIILADVFLTNTHETIQEDPAVLLDVLQSSLLVLPFGLGVCLNILFLVPRAVQVHLDRGFIAVVVTAMACGLAMGIGYMFDSLLNDFDSIMVMMIFGILLGFGAALTRSFYITYTAFSIVLLIRILNSTGTVEEPLPGLLIGFALTSAILVLSLAKQKGYL